MPLILHICGNTLDRMDYIAQTGMAAFHFDSKNDPQAAMDTVAGRIGLVGNINNPETLYAPRPRTGPPRGFQVPRGRRGYGSPGVRCALATKLENLMEIPGRSRPGTKGTTGSAHRMAAGGLARPLC